MRRRPSKPNFEEFSVCLVEEELDSFPASEHGHHLSLLGLLPYVVLQYLVCSTAAFWAAFSGSHPPSLVSWVKGRGVTRCHWSTPDWLWGAREGRFALQEPPNDLNHFLSLSQLLFYRVVTSHSSLKCVMRWSVASFAILQQWKSLLWGSQKSSFKLSSH